MFELCDRLFGIFKVNNCTSATYICPDLLEDEEKKIFKPKNSSNRKELEPSKATNQEDSENIKDTFDKLSERKLTPSQPLAEIIERN